MYMSWLTPQKQKSTRAYLEKGPHQSFWQVPGLAWQQSAKSQRIKWQKAYCPVSVLLKINALNDDPPDFEEGTFSFQSSRRCASILAGQEFSDIESLQKLLTSFGKPVAQAYNKLHRILANLPPLSNLKKRRRVQMSRPVGTSTTPSSLASSSSVCFYRTRFGPQARNCQPGCKFSSLLSKASWKDKANW